MEDELLWYRFGQQKLSVVEWTHVAHVRVAMLHLARWPLDEAHVLMRVGIVRLNASHGLVETAKRGYHETITRGWLALLAPIVARETSMNGELRTAAIVAQRGPLLGRDALLRHYSNERLFSLEARARYVEPDLAPFDQLA
jgi:hypothetical protein